MDSTTLPSAGGPRSTLSTKILATLAAIVALWWGQTFVIPVVSGLMLAMLLAPMSTWLRRPLRSQVLAALVSLFVAIATLAGAAFLFGDQLVRIAQRIPEVISVVAHRVATTEPGAWDLLSRSRRALVQLERATNQITGQPQTAATPNQRTARTGSRPPPAGASADPGTPAAAGAAPPAPASPSLTEGATAALKETAISGSGLILRFASDLTIILFVAFFLLIADDQIARRLLKQFDDDPDARHRVAGALHECGRQVRMYVAVLVLTNMIIGVVVWIAFLLASLPDAAGWGVTAAVLHLVPYVGMSVLTVLAGAEAFLAYGTWSAGLGMAAFIAVASTLIGTVVAAWLQSRASGINSAVLFVGIVFWGMMWGIWGLFLGPALVVMTKVIADHTHSGRRIANMMQS